MLCYNRLSIRGSLKGFKELCGCRAGRVLYTDGSGAISMFGRFIAQAVILLALTVGTSARAAPQSVQPGNGGRPHYVALGGTVTFSFDARALEELGVGFIGRGQFDEVFMGPRAVFEIEPSSTLVVEAEGDVFARFGGGLLRTRGAFLLDKPGKRVVIGNLTIEANSRGGFVVKSTLGGQDIPDTPFVLDSVILDFRATEGSLRLIGELSIARGWGKTLAIPRAAGAVIGTVVVDARMGFALDASVAPSAGETDDATEDEVRLGDPLVPDVIVGDLSDILRYDDEVSGITTFAVGTTSCNIGTARASWVAGTNQHPVIAQNAYRLKNDRFEQIGLSWVKHGFFALNHSLCSPCLDHTNGTELGVGCSDPYRASLNGIQTNMSPRSTVNAHTGYFTYTGGSPQAETAIDRRVQIHDVDLDPALNAGARYFVQGHYVTPGDAEARTHNNNASYREVEAVESGPGVFTLIINEHWLTQREQPAVRAWQDVDPSVVETDMQIPDEGLFILAAKVIDLGSSTWRYEYAVQNLNSDRSAMSFSVPIPPGTLVTNIGFHDVDYHSGDPYASTNWTGIAANGSVTWSTEDYATNPDANALRWGTVYNFRFEVNAWGEPGTATVGLFKPPALVDDPVEITGATVVPTHEMIDCNNNLTHDACDISCEAQGCEPPCGGSDDCDDNLVPDECQPDCNNNETADECDIASGTSADCNGDTVPDECEIDCNRNEIPDSCDITDETSEDCNSNDVPDECEIDEDSTAPGGPFFCSEDCDPDCNWNGKPDECDVNTDDDNDRVFGCDDLCPLTNPGLKCGCNEREDCCLPGFCYSDLGLPPVPPSLCRDANGEPQCNLSPLCRNGCLVGDVDDNGILDLRDVGGLQCCFGAAEGQDQYDECVRIYDFNEDGVMDLKDYVTLVDLMFNGIP